MSTCIVPHLRQVNLSLLRMNQRKSFHRVVLVHCLSGFASRLLFHSEGSLRGASLLDTRGRLRLRHLSLNLVMQQQGWLYGPPFNGSQPSSHPVGASINPMQKVDSPSIKKKARKTFLRKSSEPRSRNVGITQHTGRN